MKGGWQWGCLELNWLSSWKLTVQRGVLSILGTTTILWHHVVGVPGGTRSINQIASSLSKPTFTVLYQWTGTGIGEWLATSFIPSQIWIFKGGPCMHSCEWLALTTIKGWAGILFKTHWCNFGTFSGNGSIGKTVGGSGAQGPGVKLQNYTVLGACPIYWCPLWGKQQKTQTLHLFLHETLKT